MRSTTDGFALSFQDCLSDGLGRSDVPGVAAAIRWGDESFTASAGTASTRTGTPVTDTTLFRVGSVTKPMTATAVLKLAESGAIRLTDRVRQHLPGFALKDETAAAAVTILDLLTHRGGWEGDFIDPAADGDDGLALYVEHMRALPQFVRPGDHFSYSNCCYAVLGRLMEVTTGLTFERALWELVLGPLGVGDARFSAGEIITGWFAVGHLPGGAVLDMWELPRWARPSGGVVASAAALAEFGSAFFAGADDRLAPGIRDQMMQEQTEAVGSEDLGDGYGLGWFTRDVAGTTLISHGGDIFGQHALLVVVPSSDFACAITTNSQSGPPLSSRVCEWVLQECLGLDASASGKERLASADAWTGLPGHYESGLHAIDVEYRADGAGHMELTPKPLVPEMPAAPSQATDIKLLADDVILLANGDLAGSRARVVRGPDGAVRFLRVAGRLAVKASGPSA